uniref:MobA-like NTP transferase domain-containing protein n=1 Tax=mine drainage metagenome TaxID=410659 RepID=E6QJZ7_9ZZZZ
MLGRSVRLARESGVESVFVVLGAFARSIATAVEPLAAVSLINTRWKTGMASSVKSGVRRVMQDMPEANAVLMIVCDQPYLSTEHLRLLMAEFAAKNAESIVASEYAGDMGIPAVFPRSQFDALLRLEGDQGARSLLRNATCPVCLIPFAGGEVDVDSPEDLQALV